ASGLGPAAERLNATQLFTTKVKEGCGADRVQCCDEFVECPWYGRTIPVIGIASLAKSVGEFDSDGGVFNGTQIEDAEDRQTGSVSVATDPVLLAGGASQEGVEVIA
ncbi:hypothetical protein, partial [Mycobacterium avium]|uniref:hypothetical protein n=1 Tax=Mycobacterium avium TaxID=1764 RepID=UPI001592E7C0